MATVREGVMKMEPVANPTAPEVKVIDIKKYMTDTDLCVKIISREIEERKITLKGAPVLVS